MRYKKVIFISLTGILFLAFGISAYKMYLSSQPLSENSIVSNSQTEAPESFPVFDRDNSQAKGVILTFKHWPLNQKEKELVLKKLSATDLKKESEYPRFKSWVFEWPDWRKGLEAERVCQAVSDLPFLDYCEPDYLLGPANKPLQDLSPPNQPTPPDKPPVSIRRGDLKTCFIVPVERDLDEGALSDYWAQEMIGADLLKEELKKVPPPAKKHFIAVFDVPRRRGDIEHDIGVKNLISDEGNHSVLPEIGEKIKIHQTGHSSRYLKLSDHFLDTVQKQCRVVQRQKEETPY